MTTRDANGIPILGAAASPEEQTQQRLQALQREKANLAADDHDWRIIANYHVGEGDAERILAYQKSGIPAVPPIILAPVTMAGEPIGPICDRCEQFAEHVGGTPCLGMPFREYLAQLPDDVRNQVLAKLQAGEMPADSTFTVEGDGTVSVAAPELVVP